MVGTKKIRDWFSNDEGSCFSDIDYKAILKKRVPITSWLPKYRTGTFLHDLLAGFTVSLTQIPQSIALATVAGLEPQYGLYSCIIGGIIYAILGTCKDINVGPTSLMSLIIQPYVTKCGPAGCILLSFFGGIIMFFLGLFNLGFLIEFFSIPIIAGFTSAASVEIASSQLNNLLGIPGRADSFIEAWRELVDNIYQTALWDTILGVLSLACLIFLREIKRFGTLQYRPDWSKRHNIIGIIIFMISLARNAIIIIVGVILAYCLRESSPFRLTGEVTGGFPPFQLPAFSTTYDGKYFELSDIISELGTGIIFIPLIGILELISIAKAFTKGRSLDATQEILTLGVINVLSSFVGSMPITGGFSRSAINNASGVKTPLSGIFISIMAILAIAFLTPVFYYVPKATMASVIICAMIYLFEYEAFVTLWKNKKSDLIPLLVTFICCLTISLEYGILIGICVNILFVLYPSARPKISIENQEIPKVSRDLYIVKPLDNLYFPAAEYLRDKVLACQGKDVILVVDGEYLRTIDITVAKSIVVLAQEIQKRGETIMFLHFKQSIIDVCVGLDENIQNCFCQGDLEDVIEGSIFRLV